MPSSGPVSRQREICISPLAVVGASNRLGFPTRGSALLRDEGAVRWGISHQRLERPNLCKYLRQNSSLTARFHL